MAMFGLDIQQVRQLSVRLNSEAQSIQQILTTLTNQLNSTQWEGPDASNFRSDWSGPHSAALKNVVSALQEASQRAAQNATEQEQVSNAR